MQRHGHVHNSSYTQAPLTPCTTLIQSVTNASMYHHNNINQNQQDIPAVHVLPPSTPLPSQPPLNVQQAMDALFSIIKDRALSKWRAMTHDDLHQLVFRQLGSISANKFTVQQQQEVRRAVRSTFCFTVTSPAYRAVCFCLFVYLFVRCTGTFGTRMVVIQLHRINNHNN